MSHSNIFFFEMSYFNISFLMSVAFSHKNSPDQNIHQSNAWYFSSFFIKVETLPALATIFTYKLPWKLFLRLQKKLRPSHLSNGSGGRKQICTHYMITNIIRESVLKPTSESELRPTFESEVRPTPL